MKRCLLKSGPLSFLVCLLSVILATPALAAPRFTLSSLSPSSAAAGSSGFTLTVRGSGFNGKCVVLWNGQALPTNIVSGSSATATVPAADVASAGTETVTVQNGRTGVTSNSLAFTVTAATVTVSVSPQTASLLAGASQQFSASVTGSSNTGVTWTASGGSITSSGLYTAPSTSGSYTVKATSVADPTKSAAAAVTVTAPVSVSVSPNSASLAGGASQQFTATVTGTTNTGVAWTTSGGAINSSGLYVAPTTAGTYTVMASSAADPTKSASATVTVTAPVSVSVSPNSASLAGGASQQFTATVTGTTNTGVAWTTSGGAINSSGLYVAPTTAGTYTVMASSAADPTKSASATVTVTAPVSVSVSPNSASLAGGASQQFTATVTGTTNTGVAWTTSGGAINSTGLYVAPTTAGTYTVKATSVADATKSASATVTVTSNGSGTTVSVAISPQSASLPMGGTQQFTASVSGTTNTGVTWTASGGVITAAGVYTAPSTAGSYTVTATSVADTTKKASAAVTVSAPLAHSVQLSWLASISSAVVGYDIYRSTVSGSGYALLNSQVDAALSYTDNTVQAGQTYYYVVTAVTSTGAQSSNSTQVTAVIPSP